VADHPPSLDPADDGPDPSDRGWGSPVPAEYGPLRAFRSTPTEDDGSLTGRGRQAGPGWRWQRQHQGAKPTLSDRWRGRPGPEVQPVTELNTGVAPTEPWGPTPTLDNGAVDGVAASTALMDAAAIVETDDRRTAAPPEEDFVDLAPPAPLTAERGGVAPAVVAAESVTSRRRQRRKADRVRSRVTIRHIDVWTVARVSLVFYLLVAIAVVVASVLLWYAANAYGSLNSIEKSVRTLFDLKTFTLHVDRVAEYTAAGGLVLALVGTLVNILAALTYNLICDIVGGFRIEVESASSGSSDSQG
jgi:Transmembrane domain of unknown function (DUF3566)